jgi:hypothetical protein
MNGDNRSWEPKPVNISLYFHAYLKESGAAPVLCHVLHYCTTLSTSIARTIYKLESRWRSKRLGYNENPWPITTAIAVNL